MGMGKSLKLPGAAQFDVGIFWLEKSIEGEVPPTLFDGSMMGV